MMIIIRKIDQTFKNAKRRKQIIFSFEQMREKKTAITFRHLWPINTSILQFVNTAKIKEFINKFEEI